MVLDTHRQTLQGFVQLPLSFFKFKFMLDDPNSLSSNRMSPGTWPLPLRHLVQKAFILRFLLADAPTTPGWKLCMFLFLCSKCPGFIPRFNYFAEKVHLQIDAPSQTAWYPSCPCFFPQQTNVPASSPVSERTQEAWLQSEGASGTQSGQSHKTEWPGESNPN